MCHKEKDFIIYSRPDKKRKMPNHHSKSHKSVKYCLNKTSQINEIELKSERVIQFNLLSYYRLVVICLRFFCTGEHIYINSKRSGVRAVILG